MRESWETVGIEEFARQYLDHDGRYIMKVAGEAVEVAKRIKREVPELSEVAGEIWKDIGSAVTIYMADRREALPQMAAAQEAAGISYTKEYLKEGLRNGWLKDELMMTLEGLSRMDAGMMNVPVQLLDICLQYVTYLNISYKVRYILNAYHLSRRTEI